IHACRLAWLGDDRLGRLESSPAGSKRKPHHCTNARLESKRAALHWQTPLEYSVSPHGSGQHLQLVGFEGNASPLYLPVASSIESPVLPLKNPCFWMRGVILCIDIFVGYVKERKDLCTHEDPVPGRNRHKFVSLCFAELDQGKKRATLIH